ncbi:MAG: hypothetical protein Q4G60_03155 [bacterium]|nr:hypothetical protein [bacterium]
MITFNDYQLGIIFATSSCTENAIVVRHQNKFFLDQVAQSTCNTVYGQIINGKPQYVLKMYSVDIKSLCDIGYGKRNDADRTIPESAGIDFLKAYLEIHSRADWQTAYSGDRGKKYKKVRIRVYGTEKMLGGINSMLNQICGTTIKSLQKTGSDKSFYLSYGNQKEIQDIVNVMDYEPGLTEYWEKIQTMLFKKI